MKSNQKWFMNRINRNIILLLLYLYLFTSCTGYVIYSDKSEIESGIWEIKDSIVISASISDIEKICNVYINLDIDENFLTNNLWLFISTKSPSGNIQSDSLMFYITDSKGKWFGKKRKSKISNKFLYKNHIRFPEKGSYIFSIKHGMRNKDLPKVHSVGVSIEEAEETKESH